MPRTDIRTFDVVIVGAGIGGLVCGCYLAKAGKKVLIVEQHHIPGGYCTTFRRRQFQFDAAANTLGGVERGVLSAIIKELRLDELVRFTRFDPSDIVVTNDYTISFWNDNQRTREEVQRVFPDESKNLDNFLDIFLNPVASLLSSFRYMTFQDVLDRFFNSSRLKRILATPLSGFTGLAPSQLSAIVGHTVYSQQVLDGGYYPIGGMQAFSDALANRFRTFGGDLRLQTRAINFEVQRGKITGVILKGDERISAGCVVSDCDANSTFIDLIGKEHCGSEMLSHLSRMTPSVSMFIAYLGVNGSIGKLLASGANIWKFANNDLESVFREPMNETLDVRNYMVHGSADNKTITALTPALFKEKQFWSEHKSAILDDFIRQLEEDLIPGLSADLLFKDAATPATLWRYTGNQKGSAYGWAPTTSQYAIMQFRKPPFIDNLYLAGHWATYGAGIAGVSYLGRDTARQILRKTRIN